MSAVDPFAALGILTEQITELGSNLDRPLRDMVAQVERIEDPAVRSEAAALVASSLVDLFDALHSVQRRLRTAVDRLDVCIITDDDVTDAYCKELN